MPSHLDLDPTSTSDGAATAARHAGDQPTAELLASIKAEGGRRRVRRHRRTGVLLGAALVAVMVPAIALLGSGDGPRQRVTSVAGQVADITLPAAVPTTVTTAAPAATVPATTVVTAPPVTLDCRNSANSACGPFRWDPAPAANQSLQATITVDPTTYVVRVTWSDPDAGLFNEAFDPNGVTLGGGCSSTPKHGPWTPPAQQPGSGELSYQGPTEPGQHTVAVSLRTGGADCDHPYASETALTATYTV